MKKIIVILLLTTAFTLSALEPTGGIKVSAISGNFTQYRDGDYLMFTNISPELTIKIDLTLGAYLTDNLLLSGSIETYTEKSTTSMYFNPYQSDYFIGVSYIIGDIVIGVEHACYHPVTSSVSYIGKTGGYNMAFVEWEF